MMKKLLSLLLAATLVMSMSVMAVAEVSTEGDEVGPGLSGDDIGGTVQVPKIYMKLPTFDTQAIIFDTYNQLGENQQIISADLTFQNFSVVPVKLTLASYAAYTSSNTAVVSVDDPAAIEDDTAKNLLLWLNTAEKDADNNDVLVTPGTPGTYTWPVYDKATLHNRVITNYATGSVKTNSIDVDMDLNAKMLRGTKAVEANGVITREKIEAVDLGTSNTVTLKFDGAMNTKATWDNDEIIAIVPTFKLQPEAYEVPQVKAVLTAPASTPAASVTGGTPINVTSSIKPTAGDYPLSSSDNYYTLTLTDSDGVPKTLTSASKVVVAADGTIAITAKCNAALTGDKLTFQLLPAAFPAEANVTANSTLVEIILS